ARPVGEGGDWSGRACRHRGASVISDASLSQEPVTRNLFLARSYLGEASSPAGLTHGLSPLLSLRAQRSNLGISRDQTIEIASWPAAPRNNGGRARRVRPGHDGEASSRFLSSAAAIRAIRRARARSAASARPKWNRLAGAPATGSRS